MVVVCAPLVEVIGNVVATEVGCGVFKVDNNVLVVSRGSLRKGGVEEEKVSVLRVVV